MMKEMSKAISYDSPMLAADKEEGCTDQLHLLPHILLFLRCQVDPSIQPIGRRPFWSACMPGSSENDSKNRLLDDLSFLPNVFLCLLVC
jgi:hypothetical protein